jgi:serine protease Do
MVAAIAAAERSVVAIARGAKDQGDAATLANPDFIPKEYATGVVVDRNGLILTNYHVLGDVPSSAYVVWAGGRAYANARVKAADPWSDLAVLEIDAQGLTPITFGDVTALRKGRIVIALGNPHAIARDGNVCATWGIISNLGRKIDGPLSQVGSRASVDAASKETMHHFGGLIQTDARLSLGTSGGPLLNLQGQMIGLTTSLAALAGYERSAGFAIPVDEAFQRVVERLKEVREVEYGFLGVAPENLQQTQGNPGVQLVSVEPGTPAYRHGLRTLDVVTHIDGKAVHNRDDLFLHVGSLPADHVAEITLKRGSQRITEQVRLAKKYIQASRPVITTAAPRIWRGLQVDYATAIPPGTSGIDPDGCVAVKDVQLDSPAWRSGLRPGVFISHVADRRVTNPDEFHASVGSHPGAVQLRCTTRIGDDVNCTVPAEDGNGNDNDE